MNISSLAYVIVESTDLLGWKRFAQDVLGMMIVERAEHPDCLFLKMDDFAHRIIIQRGTQNRFLRAGWQVAHADQFEHSLKRLTGLGIACNQVYGSDLSIRQVQGCVQLVAPGNIELELCHSPMIDYETMVSSVGVPRFVTGEFGSMGLGHIAVATPDLASSHRFFTEVLGFGQTDYMHFYFNPDQVDHPGQGLHFLHCDNARHHSIALYESLEPASGNLVHLMVEVPDMDTLGALMDRVRQHEVKVITPLGKHTNDQMVSTYVESPAGFAIEYGFGGLQCDWQRFTPTRSAKPSLWGHHWGV